MSTKTQSSPWLTITVYVAGFFVLLAVFKSVGAIFSEPDEPVIVEAKAPTTTVMRKRSVSHIKESSTWSANGTHSTPFEAAKKAQAQRTELDPPPFRLSNMGSETQQIHRRQMEMLKKDLATSTDDDEGTPTADEIALMEQKGIMIW